MAELARNLRAEAGSTSLATQNPCISRKPGGRLELPTPSLPCLTPHAQLPAPTPSNDVVRPITARHGGESDLRGFYVGTCPDCGGVLVEVENGELLCPSCGLVW